MRSSFLLILVVWMTPLPRTAAIERRGGLTRATMLSRSGASPEEGREAGAEAKDDEANAEAGTDAGAEVSQKAQKYQGKMEAPDPQKHNMWLHTVPGEGTVSGGAGLPQPGAGATFLPKLSSYTLRHIDSDPQYNLRLRGNKGIDDKLNLQWLYGAPEPDCSSGGCKVPLPSDNPKVFYPDIQR